MHLSLTTSNQASNFRDARNQLKKLVSRIWRAEGDLAGIWASITLAAALLAANINYGFIDTKKDSAGLEEL